jgi:CRISPR-associated protein Cas1
LGISLAKSFVYGKIKNQYSLLKYYWKYRRNNGNTYGERFAERRRGLEELILKVKTHAMGDDPTVFRQQLMAIEGRFGAEYWGLLKLLLRDGIEFPGRERRGAKDLVNSLLNYGYAILGGHVLNAITRSGLNPTTSFLHSYQSGKPTLVYDLQEEFRADAVDRVVISLLDRGSTVTQDADGLLDKASREKLTRAVLARLGTEVWHCGKQRSMEEVICLQAENLKQHLLGKRKYRPYLCRW